MLISNAQPEQADWFFGKFAHLHFTDKHLKLKNVTLKIKSKCFIHVAQ